MGAGSTKRGWQTFGEKCQKGKRIWKLRQEKVSRRMVSNASQRPYGKGLKDVH